MKTARRGRRGIAGIIAIVIIFAIMFSVGTSYFVFENAQNASYVSSLLAATNKVQTSDQENMTITTLLESDGDVGFFANDTSSLTINMTALLVISSTGTLVKCDGVGFPSGSGCSNSTPSLWVTMNAGGGSPTIDTGYLYTAGTTDTVKVLTARGNTYSETYPEPASQSGSTQSVTVNLDNLKWVQLIPETSSLVQKNYVSNCNSASCAASYTSHVTAGNILVDAIGWASQAPPSGVPTDTVGSTFSLGASSTVAVPATPSVVQSNYKANCNAITCGLAFSSNVASGHTLVYAVGWANQAAPSAPSDTRGDAFTLGASSSITVNPTTPSVVQRAYTANCNSATCALAYTNPVTAGNTLVLGLGWPTTQLYNYVPIIISNTQSTATPNPFQQSITWDPATFSSYEATNLGNVRFCSDVACATPYYSWLESCSSTCSSAGSSSTSATAWVKLTSSIAATSTLVIYMVFKATSTNFDGVYWGEAPQLSGTYAQYDNGASVFTFYDNFAGTTLSSLWTNNVSNAGGTLTINNGLSYTRPSGSNNDPFIYSTTTYSQGVYETYGAIPTGGSGGSYTYAGYGIASSTNINNGAYVGDINSAYALYTGTGSADNIVSGLTGGTYIWSVFVPSSAPSSISGSQNYGTAITSSSDMPTLPENIVFFDQHNTGINIGTFDWARDRAYPPSGVMPTASVATLTGATPTYIPITITNSQSTATPATFQQMVTWDPATYQSYEADNLGNIRFCSNTTCSTELYSWLESCSSTCSTAGFSSTTATAWVQLTSAISANGGTLTIYMEFMPLSTTFDGVHWGEAPQLSPIYAQYDNGASVFTAYFNGNTATSSFSVYSGYTLAQATGTTGPGGTTINALELSGYTATNAPFPALSYNTAMSNSGLITESSFSSPGCTTANPYTGTDTGAIGLLNNAAVTSVNNAVSANCGYAGDYFDQDYDTAGTYTSYSNSQGTATSSWLYGTLTYAGSGASSWSAYIAPQLYSSTGGDTGTINNNSISGATHLYLGQISYSSNGYAITIYYNFMRARAYPPNNTMPSTSFGSISGAAGAPTISDSLGDSYTQAASNTVQQGSSSTLSVDGTGFHVCGSAGTTCSVSLTTSHTNDVIVLFSSTNGAGTGYPTISSISGGGLSWQENGRAECETNCNTGQSGTYYDTDEWYAIASGTLSSVSFTVTLAHTSQYTDLSVFGVNGANLANPFDTNPSLPATLTSSSGTYPSATTSNSDDMIIGAADLYVTTASVGSGFTTLGYTSGDYFADEYVIESSVQSGLSVGYSVGSTSANNAIADAIEGATTSSVSSGVWYATASSSASDTITATFAASVAGSVSIYEIAGYSTSGVLSSSGSSTGGSTSASVTSFTPSSNSFVVGDVETGSTSTEYTAGSGYATVAAGSGGCDASDASQGCSEYETGLGTATTTPFTLSASTPWVEDAASLAPLASNTYYSYVWYATAASSGADTINAAFGSTVAGSVSIYELSGVTATGLQYATGSSSTSQSATDVSSITPTAGSVVIGNSETTSTTYTAGTGYTLTNSQPCAAVTGCAEYQTGVGSATTVPMSISPSAPWVESALAFAPSTTNYYSYIWYATAASSGSDTVTESFGASIAGSVSIYEITGYTTTSPLSSTGSSPSGSTTAAVTSFTPSSDSFILGNAEVSTATTFAAASGYAIDGSCGTITGCSEYYAGGGGSATTVSMSLGASRGWVEAAMAFSTPFNPQDGINVDGYPTMGVPSGAPLVWEATFTNVDPMHRSLTIWPQTELAVGLLGFDGYDVDYLQEHYYIVDGFNAGSTTVNAYTSTTSQFLTLAYDVPTTIYFAATTALGSTTQSFGTEVLTPFQAYFAMSGTYSVGTLFGETIPYPYGIITEANAYSTPTAGAPGQQVTISCTSPCDFTDSDSGMVGWINAEGQLTQMTTFAVSGGGNIPSGVTFNVPSTASAGYYIIEVTDYVNSVFMTFQVT